MLKKEKLSMQSSGLHLIDGATYYVLFEPIENSSGSYVINYSIGSFFLIC